MRLVVSDTVAFSELCPLRAPVLFAFVSRRELQRVRSRLTSEAHGDCGRSEQLSVLSYVFAVAYTGRLPHAEALCASGSKLSRDFILVSAGRQLVAFS